MNPTCSTRVLKNAKRIRTLAPHIIPAKEPAGGFASIVPLDILTRIHKMSDLELAKSLEHRPDLLDVAKQLRSAASGASNPASAQTAPHTLALFGDSPFKGTLHFVQLTLNLDADHSTHTVNIQDIQTAIQYTNLAVKPLAAYCAQYGANRIDVSQDILQLGSSISELRYNDDFVQDWVNQIVRNNRLSKDSSCIVILNPREVINTDADLNQGILGYHDKADAPYIFVNVLGVGLTVQDARNLYADTLSHEIAEMVCDPDVSWFNEEVCDACAGNCQNNWRSFFIDPSPSLANSYIQSSKTFPPNFPFTFFTATVARPGHAGDCPAPGSACAYAPPPPVGIGELLFYDRAQGLGEFYAVRDRADIAIQFSHSDWRTTWSQIVEGNFAPRNQFGSNLLFYDSSGHTGEFYHTDAVGGLALLGISHTEWLGSWTNIVAGAFSNNSGFDDLLFYDRTAGRGEFWHTDGRGNIRQLGQIHTNWRKSWTTIITGKFSDSPFADLLFYDPSTGTGEFWRSDGNGNITLFGSHTNWRAGWTKIIPGKFSDGPYTDLLFYEPSTGTGEFWRTDGRGSTSLIGGNYNWRQDWNLIVPGRFSSKSNYTDLLFYSASTGTGEFWNTNGRGAVSLIQRYTDWRTSWTTILAVL